jgi:hypothetical protein
MIKGIRAGMTNKDLVTINKDQAMTDRGNWKKLVNMVIRVHVKNYRRTLQVLYILLQAYHQLTYHLVFHHKIAIGK